MKRSEESGDAVIWDFVKFDDGDEAACNIDQLHICSMAVRVCDAQIANWRRELIMNLIPLTQAILYRSERLLCVRT